MTPVNYDKLSSQQRRVVRQKYVTFQKGKCHHCKAPLIGDPPKEILSQWIHWPSFPPGFLNHPIHLHHDHQTGMTVGAVHAYCNAVLWQYHGS